MRNRALIKYLGIIVIGCVLLSCRTMLWAEEKEKEGEKVEIEVRQDEYGTTKKKYLVTKEERDRIFKMKQAIGKTLWAIEKAYRNREIDLDTKLILKVKALQEPGSVPGKYKPIEYVKEKLELKYHQDQVKRVYREAFNKWYELKYATHKKLRPYLRGVDLEEIQADSGEIIIIGEHWDNPLVKKAYMKGEIDIDQVFLYQFGPAEEIPARFIPKRTVPLQPFEYDMQLEDVGFLPRYCKYLRPETKEKIKHYHWKWEIEEGKHGLGIRIDSPKKDKKGKIIMYIPTVKIKGAVISPEIYDITSGWGLVMDKSIRKKIEKACLPLLFSGEREAYDKCVESIKKESRKEIKFGTSVYEKPVLKEKARWKWIEEYEGYYGEEVEEFVKEYYAGPGKIIRPFEVELELPDYGGNEINIETKNTGGQSAKTKISVTHYDGTDKKPPKVKIKDPKSGALLGTYDVYERENEIMLPVLCEAWDDKKILWVEVYGNDEFAGRTFHTDREHIGYGENGKSIYADYYRVDVPIRIGKNKIKAIAYDIGGSSKSDTVKIIYSPEKR